VQQDHAELPFLVLSGTSPNCRELIELSRDDDSDTAALLSTARLLRISSRTTLSLGIIRIHLGLFLVRLSLQSNSALHLLSAAFAQPSFVI
jgi:hypothetical protein